MWPITLSGRLPIVDLVGRYLTNYLIGRELTLHQIAPLTPASCDAVVLCGIRTPFGILSPCEGQIAHALLTRPPLKHISSCRSSPKHVSARLACVRHAASVRPEPGSNSSVQSFISSCLSTTQSLRNLLSLSAFLSVSFSRFIRCLSRASLRIITPSLFPVKLFFESFLVCLITFGF